jgi:hypothetical protein
MTQRNTKSVHQGEDGGIPGEAQPPSTLQLTPDQFRAFLQSLANNSGSMAELGRRLDVSGQFVGEVISGRKRPGPKLLEKLGGKVVKTTVYEITVEAQGE